MSSTTNQITIARPGTAVPIKSAMNPRISELTPAQLEMVLHETYTNAKKVAWSTDELTPETLTAMLAMYAIQEVHACGYRPPSAIRAMVTKIKSEEKVATITCLRKARRELIEEVKMARARKAQGKENGEAKNGGVGGKKVAEVDGGKKAGEVRGGKKSETGTAVAGKA